jgi:outer membrane protein insertion porin family
MKFPYWQAGVLFLLLLFSSAYAIPSSFSGLPITRIDVQDDRGRPLQRPDQIMQLIGLKSGDPFSGSAVRRSLSLLYLKGTYKDIRVEAVPDGSGLRLTYILVPITVVEKLVVGGNSSVSTDAIREAVPRIEGKELNEKKFPSIRADILALYQAEGFYNAVVDFRVETLSEPHRVALHIDVREGAPMLIAAINFIGNTLFSDKSLLAVMKSHVNSRLRRDQLLDRDREAILKKYYEAGHPTAKSGPVNISFRDHSASVRIFVSEGPRVMVRFSGNRSISKNKLRQSLLIWSEHSVSTEVIDSSVDKIKRLYREQGYPDVSVDVNKSEGPGVLDLTFVIAEGPHVTVRKIELRGNRAFTAGEIKKQMALRAPGWSWSWSPLFFWYRSFPYREDLLDKDVDNLRDRYLEAGYLAATIKPSVTRSPDGRTADVVIDVTEGPRTTTGSVTFEGNTIFTREELLNKVSLKSGAPFNDRILDDDKYRVLSAYTDKGYLYARVEVERIPTDGTINIRYQITEDHPVTIGKIILRGNVHTRTSVIMRELLVKPGDVYDYGAILASQQRIYHLGYFSLAKFEPVHPGEKEYVKDMLLTVDERPAGAVEVGVGYGDLDRLRGFVELSHRNLWGTARYTSLRFEESSILKRAIFNFQEPWLFNRDMNGKFSLVWSDSEKLNSDTRELYYKTRKTSASFGIEKSYKLLKPSLTYQFENVVNYDVLAAAQVTPEDSGRVLVSSLTPALLLDLRDDVFNPHRGALYGIALKEALRELWSQADFSKLTVQGSWFQPVGTSVLAFSARAGMAWPFRGTSEVPLHERFYVGGSTTVRGYTQDSIGPSSVDANGSVIPQGGQSMAIFNIELRLHPGEGLGFVLFTDAGNVWTKQEINPEDLRASYGVGFRYGTPIGPLRVDYGQKVHRRPGESPGELHFNIGNTF